MFPFSSLIFEIFQSTHPARGCDENGVLRLMNIDGFQSTHPARGCDIL